MTFKQPTVRSGRRSFYFEDGIIGRMTPNEEDVTDAGRQRLPRMPESNHYAAGEFRDLQRPDPASERTEAEWSDPRLTSGGNGPAYGGKRSNLPNASTNRNAGRLGTSVVEGPRGDNPNIGLSGTTAYDPAKVLSTVGRDATLLGNTSAGGMGSLKANGMGSRAETTADVIRRINQRNKRFYARDADPDEREDEATDPPTPSPHEDGPAVTRWELTQPDQSKVIHTREVHSAPPAVQHINTVDPRNPRRQPVLSGTHDTAGTQYGTLRAQSVRRGTESIAEINRRNRAAWKGN